MHVLNMMIDIRMYSIVSNSDPCKHTQSILKETKLILRC